MKKEQPKDYEISIMIVMSERNTGRQLVRPLVYDRAFAHIPHDYDTFNEYAKCLGDVIADTVEGITNLVVEKLIPKSNTDFFKKISKNIKRKNKKGKDYPDFGEPWHEIY